MSVILAIDPSSQCGWATYDGDRYLSGSVRLTRSSEKGIERDLMRAARMRDVLGGWSLTATHLVFEGSAGQRFRQSMKVACQLEGVMLVWADEWDISVSSVAPCAVKKWATGNGRASKADMMQAAKRLTGVDPEDDNEGDALCLCAMAVEKADKAYGV